jgi:hypothetical protein
MQVVFYTPANALKRDISPGGTTGQYPASSHGTARRGAALSSIGVASEGSFQANGSKESIGKVCFSCEKADQISPARLLRWLEAGDVRCLQTLRSTGHFEFNRLAFVQRFVSLSLNGREMYENVFAGLALNEPESLAGIEPLHCSLFSH